MMKTIALKHLVPSEKNVRVVGTEKEQDKELIASIKAQGILQNLVVVPTEDPEVFAVIAGGRRLGALRRLLSEGVIDGEYLVPCKVEDPDKPTALSLSENIKASMHPADEFMGYKRMNDDGKSIKQIAAEFGVSQNRVKRRLKLASVAPDLIDEFRDGSLSVDQVMALTVTDDHEKQRACINEHSFHASPHVIRQFLLKDTYRTDDKMVKFVGLADYKAAGGTTTSDLFESVSYINEVDLLESLANSKMQKLVEAVSEEGWKWVRASWDSPSMLFSIPQLEGEEQGVPAEISDALDKANEQMKALNEMDGDEWTEDHDKQLWDLEDEVERLEDQKQQYRVFTEEQKAVSGVYLYLNHAGEAVYEKGYVDKEDYRQVSQTQGGGGETDSTSMVDVDGGNESAALKTDLHNFRTQAFQSVLMKNDDLAYDIMVFTVARSILGELNYFGKVADISISATILSQTKGIEETQAQEAINKIREQLDTSWLAFEETADQFKSFRELGRGQKKKILSYCVGMAFYGDFRDDMVKDLVEAMCFNLIDHWQPTADNYFSRIRKGDLLALGKDLKGDQWVDDNQGKKKGVLVDLISQDDAIEGWLPDCLK